MPKKNLRAGASGLDKFFTKNEEMTQTESPQTAKTHETHQTHRTHETHVTQKVHTPPQTFRAAPRQESTGVYRLNLRLSQAHKEHLGAMSWEHHIPITQYLSNLIDADMNKAKKGGR